MRIAIYTASSRKRGGAETYVARVAADLQARGCSVALVHEHDLPTTHPPIDLGAAPVWSAAALGRAATVEQVRAWAPHIVYSQGGDDLDLEAALISLAPAVLFAHNYYGTCISGTKAVGFPVAQPCDREFGAACLAHYFPRRCGGLSPLTMVRRFEFERRRLALVRRYSAIITASDHMRREYTRHGIPSDRIRTIPFAGPPLLDYVRIGRAAGSPRDAASGMASPRRLIFVGRMERLKGGSLLLESLPIVVRALERPIHLTMVGTGREEQAWRRAAAEASKADSRIHVDFTGWLGDGELAPLLARSDLLVVPSIWPEPFGLVGLEAAAHGVPAVAFDVGGIREWLTPGLNGIVAPGRPPTAAGLAGAIGAALADDPTLHRLGAGAFAVAARFAERRHVDELVEVFGTISDPTAVGGAPGVAHPPVATGPGASRA